MRRATHGFRTHGVGRVHGRRLQPSREKALAMPTSGNSAMRGSRCRTFLRVIPMMTTIQRRRLPPLRRSVVAGMQRTRRRTRRSQIGTSPITSTSTVSRRRGRGPTAQSEEDVVDDNACRGAGRAAAFSDGVKSGDAARLLAEVKEATSAAQLAAETARKHALDPLLSGDDLKLARGEMEGTAFKRDRRQEASAKLTERVEAWKALEADRRMRAEHERVLAERTGSPKRWRAWPIRLRRTQRSDGGGSGRDRPDAPCLRNAPGGEL